MNLKETYNKIAQDWHKDHQSDDWWIEGTDRFISYLKPGMSILDLGCGSGVKSKYLVKNGLKVTGIDISEKLIAIAKKECPQAEFEVRDMIEVESLNKKFDGIYAQASLLHIPKKDIQNALLKIVKALKPGGYLYISVKNKNRGIDEEIKTENDYGYSYERFFSYYSFDELNKYLSDIRLKIVYKDLYEINETRWLTIIAKNKVEER